MPDTTDKSDAATADRRSFMKLAGATAAGAGATAASAVVAAPVATPPADAQYRETAHIKQYYDSAR